ncbi:MAG TPA: lipoyl synthase, partial [Chloroflexota bacterium]|nr:lipoyl synthase [Chloroflexota bacterium]
PDWLRVRFPTGPNYLDLTNIMRTHGLHTVCEEAHCPNIGECWEHRTATVMILGRVCTRACRFCAITTGVPVGVDEAEPERVADAVVKMGLRHAVITSVARDDLPDGGAQVFAETIRAIHRRLPTCSVEVLIPDFEGDAAALQTVMDAGPEILNHNLETVERLQRRVRAKAFYERSLEVLQRAKAMRPDGRTKSGIMLGLGETREEISETLRDLRAVDCDIVTIGQYLRPSEFHLPIVRYVPPEEFAEIKAEGIALGFRHVESGPLVRSSYHAHEQAQRVT